MVIPASPHAIPHSDWIRINRRRLGCYERRSVRYRALRTFHSYLNEVVVTAAATTNGTTASDAYILQLAETLRQYPVWRFVEIQSRGMPHAAFSREWLRPTGKAKLTAMLGVVRRWARNPLMEEQELLDEEGRLAQDVERWMERCSRAGSAEDEGQGTTGDFGNPRPLSPPLLGLRPDQQHQQGSSEPCRVVTMEELEVQHDDVTRSDDGHHHHYTDSGSAMSSSTNGEVVMVARSAGAPSPTENQITNEDDRQSDPVIAGSNPPELNIRASSADWSSWSSPANSIPPGWSSAEPSPSLPNPTVQLASSGEVSAPESQAPAPERLENEVRVPPSGGQGAQPQGRWSCMVMRQWYE